MNQSRFRIKALIFTNSYNTWHMFFNSNPKYNGAYTWNKDPDWIKYWVINRIVGNFNRDLFEPIKHYWVIYKRNKKLSKIK
jgi:hypothetical protein